MDAGQAAIEAAKIAGAIGVIGSLLGGFVA